MTISSPSIIKSILKANGVMEDGEFVLIYQYTSMNDKIQFACFTDDRYDDIYESPYVKNPICLFDHGITPEGLAFLSK